MAIQPIDLQTLFTQLDKVGKTQSAQREGLAMQQAIQGEQIQHKTEALIQSVNQAQNTGEGAEKVKDRDTRGQDSGEKRRQKKQRDDSNRKDAEAPVIHDPFLGRNIDISL